MSLQAILSDLKSKKYQPVYFLQGEETYFIDLIANYISKNVLDEGEQAFNQTILYGKDIEVQDVLNEAKQFPMMSDRRVVIIKEAQNLSRSIDKLTDYIKNPTDTTLLVICYMGKKLDGRKELGKIAKKSGYLFTSDKIKEYKIPEWIISEGKTHGLTVAPNAAMLLSENLGTDLHKIVKTFDKLKVVLEGDTLVDEKTVAANVGLSREYNVFQLQKALGNKDVLRANLIANHFGNNPKNHPLVVVVSNLYSYFSKILKYHVLNGKVSQGELAGKLGVSPYFIKDYSAAAQKYPMGKLARIIGYLRDADLKSKGVGNANTSHGEILKELVYKILH